MEAEFAQIDPMSEEHCQPSSFSSLLEELCKAHLAEVQELHELRAEVANLRQRVGEVMESDHSAGAEIGENDGNEPELMSPQQEKSSGSSKTLRTKRSVDSITRESSDIVNGLGKKIAQEIGGPDVRLNRCGFNEQYVDVFFGFIIVAMSIVMAAETEYTGSRMILTQEEPSQHPAFSILEWLFGVIFSLEAIYKIVTLGKDYWRDPWNLFDFVLVVSWAIQVVLELHTQGQGLGNVMVIRTLRVVRLFRLVRLLRSVKALDALYLIDTALRGSATVLGWSVVVVGLIQVTTALLLNQLLRDYMLDPAYPVDEREQVFRHFGTFGRAMLSVFELTLANWPPIIWTLTENVSEWFIMFGIWHKLVIGFAMVGVINGVFIQETFKVASSDDTIMMRRKQQAAEIHKRKMEMLFKRADKHNKGFITFHGFKEVMSDNTVQAWLAAQELDAHDLNAMFNLLDDAVGESDGHITKDELYQGVSRLKGFARSIDVVTLLNNLQELTEKVDIVAKALHRPGSVGSSSFMAALSSPGPASIKATDAANIKNNISTSSGMCSPSLRTSL